MKKKNPWLFVLILILIAVVVTVIVKIANPGFSPLGEAIPEPTPCAHSWEAGICTQCGTQCEHVFTQGVCKICGMPCNHDWQHGVCKKCGLLCAHDKHDSESLLCVDCGEHQPHELANAKCRHCDYEPAFYDDFLPDEFYTPCNEQGKVLTFNYGTNFYGSVNGTVKGAKIYLPYGYDHYDKDTKYDVMIVIHGMGGSENDMISASFPYGGKTLCMRNIYDHMIQDGLCKPMIIVGICTYAYLGEEYEDTGARQIGYELRETILPYIVNHFNTYAENSNIEAISAARQHFGIGGLSNGSLYALNSGMIQNFDLFGNYACFSGNNYAESVVRVINEEENKNLPIFCFMAGAGVNGSQQGNSSRGFETIVKGCDRLTEGENAFYIGVNAGHDWKTWTTCMYDALLVLFQDV